MSVCPLCGAAVPAGATRCPECRLDLNETDPAGPPPLALPVEPVEATPAPPAEPVVEASPVLPAVPAPEEPHLAPLLDVPPAGGGKPPSKQPVTKQGLPATVVDRPPPGPSETVPFRPVRRPPLLLLCVLDDGRHDGEWVRIRTPRFIIGRTEGELQIPHDSMMSSRHAAITRQPEKDRHRWFLSDLQSTNGTYLKVSSVVLRHGQEFLIGSRRLRFDAPQRGAPPADPSPSGTQGWQAVAPVDLIPSLVELTPQGEGKRYFLTRPDNWIGREPAQCSVALADDPLVDLCHARLYRDARDRWRLDNNHSLNGVWLRIEKVPLDASAQFQLGEQRFAVKFV